MARGKSGVSTWHVLQRPPHCLTITEAAKILYLNIPIVCTHIRDGELEVREKTRGTVTKRWVTMASVEAFIERHATEVAARALKKGILK